MIMVAAIYVCCSCSKKFSIEPSNPPINPKCIFCEYDWVRWINFEQYLKQWE